MVCLCSILSLLGVEMLNKSAMRTKKKQFRSRLAINSIIKNLKRASKAPLKIWHFLPKLNWHYIFQVELAG